MSTAKMSKKECKTKLTRKKMPFSSLYFFSRSYTCMTQTQKDKPLISRGINNFAVKDDDSLNISIDTR